MSDDADIRTVEVGTMDEEHVQMEVRAKEVAQVLTTAYPNYPWAVGWHPGAVLAVKLLINPNYNYGWTIDAKQLSDPSFLVKISKQAGGELLERLGLSRKAWDGSMPTQNMEGIDKGREVPIFDVNNVKGVIG